MRTARKGAGLSQQELEELTGIAQGDISKYESGRRLVSETVAQQLARHLPVTTPTGLLMANKAQAFKRAQETGDRVGALKRELLHRHSWPSRESVRVGIFEYIECFYNPRRRHSSLGHLSPAEYEQARLGGVAVA